MKRRCYDQGRSCYKHYGGRGIVVCERWRSSFANFLTDMGEAPDGMTLDRIDSNGNYEPSNCRWASWDQQQRNRRDNIVLSAFGETKVAIDWARDPRCPVSDGTIINRIRRGWSPERAITTPSQNQPKEQEK